MSGRFFYYVCFDSRRISALCLLIKHHLLIKKRGSFLSFYVNRAKNRKKLTKEIDRKANYG